MKTKFKAGDKVICIKDGYEKQGVYKGKGYEVCKIENRGMILNGIRGTWNNTVDSIYPDTFKLYKESDILFKDRKRKFKKL